MHSAAREFEFAVHVPDMWIVTEHECGKTHYLLLFTIYSECYLV